VNLLAGLLGRGASRRRKARGVRDAWVSSSAGLYLCCWRRFPGWGVCYTLATEECIIIHDTRHCKHRVHHPACVCGGGGGDCCKCILPPLNGTLQASTLCATSSRNQQGGGAKRQRLDWRPVNSHSSPRIYSVQWVQLLPLSGATIPTAGRMGAGVACLQADKCHPLQGSCGA
jgi:hypothetical protein